MIRVDEDQVGRVRAGELQRRLRVIGPLALERARTDDGLLGERVGQRVGANDEHRNGREAGRVVGLLARGRDARVGFARRGLSPRERRQVVEDLGHERDLLFAKPARLRAPVEHGEHFLKRARHRLEPQQARARAEGVQAASKLVAGRLRRRVVFERAEQLARVAHLAAERGDEIGPRSAEAPTRGVPGLGRAARHDPTRP